MRTQLSRWQIKGRNGEGEVMKYIELKNTPVAHIPNETVVYDIPFEEGVSGLLIKTIRVVSEENVIFVVDIMEGGTDESIYRSLDELKKHYDQVDIPYRPEEKVLNVKIHNKGSVTTKFQITVTGIEVE